MSAGDALREFAEAASTDLGSTLAAAAAGVNHEVVTRLVARGENLVRPSHIPVFAGLDPEGTQISTLAHRAGVSRQAMSALVREVESNGMVTTAPDPADGRAVLVTLTDRGAVFCRTAVEVTKEVSAEWRTTLGGERVDELLATLRAIAAGGR